MLLGCTLLISGCFGWPVFDRHHDTCSQEGCATDAFRWGKESDADSGAYCTPEILLFKRGLDGYDSTVDIEVRQEHPSTSYPSGQLLSTDLKDGSSDDTQTQVLIRFNDIFGEGVRQIPSDAEIMRASLTLWVTNGTDDTISLHRMLNDWHSEDTWDYWNAGVVNDDIEALAMADARLSSPDIDDYSYSFNVISSLLAWQSNPASNYGWVVLDDGTDGLAFASSEYAMASQRPVLEVVVACGNTPEVALDNPADGVTDVSTTSSLQVTVKEPYGGALDVVFYGRERRAETWTLIALPDTQRYTETASYNEIFTSQTQWIVDNRDALNIQMVVHEGDIVQDWDDQGQWDVASAALSLLSDNDIPFAPIPGNHDHVHRDREGETLLYSATFPASDFERFSWWEENSDYNDNNNNYVTLTIGEERYIFIGLDFCPFPDEIEWANDVLYSHPGHKAILTTHAYIRDTDGVYTGREMCPDTSYIFDDLINHHDNLQIVLCGHNHEGDGEYYRLDYNSNAVLVHQLVADYQSRERGGGGRLRIMTFDPNDDAIYVQTYSPYTDTYETDADSEFTLPYDMDGGAPFVALGTLSGVPSGGHATFVWSGLNSATTYEWYVEVKGTDRITTSPVWRLTTTDACGRQAECDDGDVCTDDICIDGTCTHTDAGACGTDTHTGTDIGSL